MQGVDDSEKILGFCVHEPHMSSKIQASRIVRASKLRSIRNGSSLPSACLRVPVHGPPHMGSVGGLLSSSFDHKFLLSSLARGYCHCLGLLIKPLQYPMGQGWGLQPGNSVRRKASVVCPGPQGGGGTRPLVSLLTSSCEHILPRKFSYLFSTPLSPTINSLGLAIFGISTSL